VISSVGVHTGRAWGFTPVEGYDKNVTYSSGRCPARAYLDRLLGSVQARPRRALPGARSSGARAPPAVQACRSVCGRARAPPLCPPALACAWGVQSGASVGAWSVLTSCTVCMNMRHPHGFTGLLSCM